MNTWPEVSVSSPATQCMSVDLPEPDGPMIAVKRPACEVDGDAVEGSDLGVAAAVDLHGVDGPGDGGCGGARRWERRRPSVDGSDRADVTGATLANPVATGRLRSSGGLVDSTR